MTTVKEHYYDHILEVSSLFLTYLYCVNLEVFTAVVYYVVVCEQRKFSAVISVLCEF